jgi:hypothetical protein
MIPTLESFISFKAAQNTDISSLPHSRSSLPQAVLDMYNTIQALFTRPSSRLSIVELTVVHVFHAACIAYILMHGGLYGVMNQWAAPLLTYFAMRNYVNLFYASFIAATLPSSFIASLPSYRRVALSAALQASIPEIDTHVPEKLKDLRSRIHWIHCIILFGTPIISVYGASMVPLSMPVAIWSLVYYFMTGMGITAGYHRLWSHQSYKASKIVEFYLLCAASGALEGSLKW